MTICSYERLTHDALINVDSCVCLCVIRLWRFHCRGNSVLKIWRLSVTGFILDFVFLWLLSLYICCHENTQPCLSISADICMCLICVIMRCWSAYKIHEVFWHITSKLIFSLSLTQYSSNHPVCEIITKRFNCKAFAELPDIKIKALL